MRGITKLPGGVARLARNIGTELGPDVVRSKIQQGPSSTKPGPIANPGIVITTTKTNATGSKREFHSSSANLGYRGDFSDLDHAVETPISRKPFTPSSRTKYLEESPTIKLGTFVKPTTAKLALGESDVPVSKEFSDAVDNANRTGKTGYGPSAGIKEAREVAAEIGRASCRERV